MLEQFVKINQQGKQRPDFVIVFAFCKSSLKLHWGRVSPLFQTYQVRKSVGEQSKEWQTAFSKHVDEYGFAYARLDKD